MAQKKNYVVNEKYVRTLEEIEEEHNRALERMEAERKRKAEAERKRKENEQKRAKAEGLSVEEYKRKRYIQRRIHQLESDIEHYKKAIELAQWEINYKQEELDKLGKH